VRLNYLYDTAHLLASDVCMAGIVMERSVVVVIVEHDDLSKSQPRLTCGGQRC